MDLKYFLSRGDLPPEWVEEQVRLAERLRALRRH